MLELKISVMTRVGQLSKLFMTFPFSINVEVKLKTRQAITSFREPQVTTNICMINNSIINQ